MANSRPIRPARCLGLLGLDRFAAAGGKPARLDVSAKRARSARQLKFEGKLSAGPDRLPPAKGHAAVLHPTSRRLLDFEQFAGFDRRQQGPGPVGAPLRRCAANRRSGRGGRPRCAGGHRGSDRRAPPIRGGHKPAGPPSQLSGARPVSPAGSTSRRRRAAFRTLAGGAASEMVLVRFQRPRRSYSRTLRASLARGRLDGRLSVTNGFRRSLGATFASGSPTPKLGGIFASADRPATSGRFGVPKPSLKVPAAAPPAFVGSLAGFGTITIEQALLVGLNPEVFGAVVRAVELGIPTEGKSHSRVRQPVRSTMPACRLSKASRRHWHQRGSGGACAILPSGRTAPTCTRSSNVDLADAMLDALLTLDAPPSAPGAVQPGRDGLRSRGRCRRPKRSVNTNLLTNWLTLRARRATIQAARCVGSGPPVRRPAAAAGCAPRRQSLPSRWIRQPPAASAPAFGTSACQTGRPHPMRPVECQEMFQAPAFAAAD